VQIILWIWRNGSFTLLALEVKLSAHVALRVCTRDDSIVIIRIDTDSIWQFIDKEALSVEEISFLSSIISALSTYLDGLWTGFTIGSSARFIESS